jgi:tight adherence protein C
VDAAVADVLPEPREFERRREPWLGRWLALAGYRGAGAARRFLAAQATAGLAGALLAWAMVRSGAVPSMMRTLSVFPGGVGEFFVSVASMGPWIVFAVVASVPAVVVRARRRERVASVEEDLPLLLDLFATLAEAGLGFDAALNRVLESQPKERPLAQEFAAYQRETLAGVPRAQALRQLAWRTEVSAVTVFISALVQAEQIGSSLAETLRHQAGDLRDRRKMRALLLAQSLPVKLVFPLIVCFLPGIFVATLGPAMYQMIKIADGILRNYR